MYLKKEQETFQRWNSNVRDLDYVPKTTPAAKCHHQFLIPVLVVFRASPKSVDRTYFRSFRGPLILHSPGHQDSHLPRTPDTPWPWTASRNIPVIPKTSINGRLLALKLLEDSSETASYFAFFLLSFIFSLNFSHFLSFSHFLRVF